MASFKEQISAIKEAYNIVDLIESENVNLKSAGPSIYKGLCPFHSEKTPSFTVNEQFQNYRCFGCGANGDIITFIQETHGWSLIEAVKYLAKNKGISLELNDYKPDDGPKIDIKKMYSLVKDAEEFYRSEFIKLDNSHPAKKEVLKRGMSVDNPVFGYAPERNKALYSHLLQLGYSEELMLQSELIASNNNNFYDFFYGRLTITLSDFNGRPVSFSARKLFDTDNRAKWVNGKQSPVFQKKSVLFNLHNAKKSARLNEQIILAEGPFDVLALTMAGCENAVASCGTAFTEEHLKAARQLVGENGTLIFAFDGDAAGIQAAVKEFIHFPISHAISKIALFPENQDPCDCLLAAGPERVKQIIDEAIPITDFILKVSSEKTTLDDMDSRYRFIRYLTSKIFPIMTDSILRDYMIRQASIMAGIDINKINELITQPKEQNLLNNKKTQSSDEKLHIQIELNEADESDMCYVKAFSILIKDPKHLAKITNKVKVPDKFKNFLKEIALNYKKYTQKNMSFRFIPEDYSDSDFAKYLLNINNDNEYSDIDEMKSHYLFLLQAAEKFYIDSLKEQKKINIINALSSTKTNDELISMLKLLNK